MAYCSLICTPDSFRPTDCSRVRWLDWENDYPLARAYWPQDAAVSQEDWEQNRTEGFRYVYRHPTTNEDDLLPLVSNLSQHP